MALGGHTKRIKVMGTVTTTKLRTKQMRVRTLILRFTSTIYGHDWERTQDNLDYCASWKLNYRIFKWPSSVSRRCFTRVFSLRRHGRTFNTSSSRLLMWCWTKRYIYFIWRYLLSCVAHSYSQYSFATFDIKYSTSEFNYSVSNSLCANWKCI